MILSDIRDYLKQRGQCSLSDIALHFDSDADAVRGMLDVWVRKGKVEKNAATPSCGTSCQSCDPAATEFKIQDGKELPVGPGIGNNGLAPGVIHNHRLGHAIMGVSAKDCIQAGNNAGEF